MNLFPYVKEEKYQDLLDEKEELEEELREFKNKFEAESERRSKLSKRKQELDEKVNKLEQKLETIENREQKDSKSSRKIETTWMSPENFHNFIRTLESIRSPGNTLTSIYITENPSQSFQNRMRQTLDSETVSNLMKANPVLSLRTEFGLEANLRINPKLYSCKISTGTEPDIDPIKNLMEKEKTILRIESGRAQMFKAQNLEVETVWEHTARIDNQHSKGGFSQSRFENIRQEAIKEFISEVKKQLPDSGKIYGLGNRNLVKRLELEYVGGFDDNLGLIQNFYKPQKIRIKME